MVPTPLCQQFLMHFPNYLTGNFAVCQLFKTNAVHCKAAFCKAVHCPHKKTGWDPRLQPADVYPCLHLQFNLKVSVCGIVSKQVNTFQTFALQIYTLRLPVSPHQAQAFSRLKLLKQYLLRRQRNFQ